jgi:D-citramalate synthase
MQYEPGSSSDALCETIITWTNGKELKLEVGFWSDSSSDHLHKKMLNVIPTPTLSEEQMNLPLDHKTKELQSK